MNALVLQTELILVAPVPLDQHPAAVYVSGLAAGARRTMRGALNVIADLLVTGANALDINWPALRFQHCAAIRTKLAERYKPATANKMICALRGVLKAAWKLGQMNTDDYMRARDVSSVGGSTLPAGRALASGEIVALLDACANDPTSAGVRDAAILALLRAAGLRRAEICELNLDDYNAETQTLVVRGKRNKEREVPIAIGAAEAIADWLTVRGSDSGPLFCPINKGGAIFIRRMQPEAVFNALNKRAKAAGVSDLSPHDFRRTFVSDLLDAGADIAVVQKLAGHANVNTTARYDRRGEAAKRKAVDLLHVPYHRRMM